MTTTSDQPVAEAGLLAGLSVQVGRLADVVALQQGRLDDQERLNRATRYVKPPAAFGTVPASGTLILGHRGPPTGYMWTVRRITVTDSASASATCAGSAWIYAGVISGGASAVGGPILVPENVEWALPSLPNVANFSADQLVLHYGEHLYVQVVGGTSTQQIKSAIAYQLYQEPGSYRREVVV
jgi:hypothetical protein